MINVCITVSRCYSKRRIAIRLRVIVCYGCTGTVNTVMTFTASRHYPVQMQTSTGATVPVALGIRRYNRSATAHHLASKPNGPRLAVMVIQGCRNGPRLSTRFNDDDDDDDTIRYDSVYLTCSKKLTGSQLSPPHGTNKKLKCETKNKTMSIIGPVQSRFHEGNAVGKRNLWWEGFVEKVGFEPGVKE